MLGCFLALCAITFFSKSKTRPERSDDEPQAEAPLFKWFYDIYYVRKQDEHGRFLENQWENKIQYTHVFLSFVLIFLIVPIKIMRALSYYFASIGYFNTGVLESTGTTKVIFSSVLYYFVFKQVIKCYEFIAIFLLIVASLMMFLSGESTTVAEGTETAAFYIVLSCALKIFSQIFLVIRCAVIKFFFGAAKEVNISALHNFTITILEIFLIIYFIILLWQGLELETLEVCVGIIGGFLFSMYGYLFAYVNVRGQAGIANAIIETKVLFQAALDWMIFGRAPNTIQYFSMCMGLGAIFFLLFMSHITSKNKPPT
ncbi:unnamed protein product [Moneuplotes crassus]|uniref:Uncharacterized protein n=1 Tax=Euplotes crassus TaxID=5936 RepID=A0AAD1UNA6_EUPCR|nr:unnamed protein product [Moneuplotes crassus]